MGKSMAEQSMKLQKIHAPNFKVYLLKLYFVILIQFKCFVENPIYLTIFLFICTVLCIKLNYKNTNYTNYMSI